MKTLSLPSIGTVKITTALYEQLRSLSLIAALGNRYFPAAGKSARLVQWLKDNAKVEEPTGQRQFPRYSI